MLACWQDYRGTGRPDAPQSGRLATITALQRRERLAVPPARRPSIRPSDLPRARHTTRAAHHSTSRTADITVAHLLSRLASLRSGKPTDLQAILQACLQVGQQAIRLAGRSGRSTKSVVS